MTTAVPVDETSLSSEPIIDVVAARHLHCSPRGPGRQSLNPRRRRRRQSSEWTPARYVTVMSRYRGFTPSRGVSVLLLPRGVVGWGRGGRRPPLFSTGPHRGTRPPLLPLFGLKFVQKLVHCCNWLLTETQCKIISVQQN